MRAQCGEQQHVAHCLKRQNYGRKASERQKEERVTTSGTGNSHMCTHTRHYQDVPPPLHTHTRTHQTAKLQIVDSHQTNTIPLEKLKIK